MNLQTKKSRLYIITFISIAAVIISIGFVGVKYFVETIKENYINQQLDLNKRTAETVSKILSNLIDKGINTEQVLDMFQESIIGSQVNEGYLCMFDQSGIKVLCHPDPSVVGMILTENNFQFENKLDKSQKWLSDAIRTKSPEGGILTINNKQRSEIAYMIPVKGTSWKISVHENIDKIEAKLEKLQNEAYIGFFILAILISIISTIASRVINVSYQRKIEEQKQLIEKQNKKLEQKVKERTFQLEKANYKLANLVKAKSDFLGIISHELRTPLNGILGYTDILAIELKGTEQEEYVEDLRISGQRLLKFSQTALLITELTSENFKMKFEEISPGDIFEVVKKENEEKINKKHIHFEKVRDHAKLTLNMSPELIKICFENIFDNAIRYTPEGGNINMRTQVIDNNFICEIEDSGPGFSEEAIQKLFDFFGADQVMHHSEGFGLGLAAAKLIMKAHEGDIQIKNKEEGGASVKLIFNLDI